MIVRGVKIKNKLQKGIFILHNYDKIAINWMDISINGLCIFYLKMGKGWIDVFLVFVSLNNQGREKYMAIYINNIISVPIPR